MTATSGEEALRLALRDRLAAALIDVAMPRMNGFEVATHLKTLERSRHIPIIFITAFGEDPEEIHRAYAAGGADYLVKPLDPGDRPQEGRGLRRTQPQAARLRTPRPFQFLRSTTPCPGSPRRAARSARMEARCSLPT